MSITPLRSYRATLVPPGTDYDQTEIKAGHGALPTVQLKARNASQAGTGRAPCDGLARAEGGADGAPTIATAARLPIQARPHPAHYQAHGRLYRAIVSLPDSMCERDRPLQERWVFFDCPANDLPGDLLEALLSLAWNIDTYLAGATEG